MSKCKFPFIFFFALVVTTVLTVNNGITIISKFSYITFLFLAILCNVKTCIILLFGMLPIQRIFALSKDFITVVPLLSLLVIIKFFLTHRLHKYYIKQLILTLILLVYSSLVEYIRFYTIKHSLEYSITVLLMLTICDLVDFRLRKSCMLIYCASSLLSALTGYFFPSVSSYTALFTMTGNIRFQGLMADPGEFGQTMVCAMAMALTLFIMANKKLENSNSNKVFLITVLSAYCLILFYFAILSGTRTCLIAIAVMYIIILYRLLHSKKRRILIFALFLGFISVLFASFVGNILFNMLSVAHGGEALSEDIRLQIWKGYILSIIDNPDVIVFGVGMNSCGTFGDIMKLGNPHNVIIEKITECGILGGIINVLIFYPLIKRKKIGLTISETLPFYVFLSTLLFYGSSGLELPYLLLALIHERREDFENENISYGTKSSYAIY